MADKKKDKKKFKGTKTLKGVYGTYKVKVKTDGTLNKGDVGRATTSERTAAKKAGSTKATTFAVNKAETGTSQFTGNVTSAKAKSLRGKVSC